MSGHDNSPFFIVGSVRSGTTLLRNLLRSHARLACPEETHFFRWGEPFASERFNAPYIAADSVLRIHRNMDGVAEHDFARLFDQAQDRGDLQRRYASAFLAAQGSPDRRWFDKTPQNVYGILLISALFPAARFVHLHRDPLNVTASLLRGEQLPAQPLNAAINHWLEARWIVGEYQRGFADRVFEIDYRNLCADAGPVLGGLLRWLNEDPGGISVNLSTVQPERDAWRRELTAEQIETVQERCSAYMSDYSIPGITA